MKKRPRRYKNTDLEKTLKRGLKGAIKMIRELEEHNIVMANYIMRLKKV